MLSIKREEFERLVSLDKSAWQALKWEMYDVYLMLPRETMNLRARDIHAVVREWFSRAELEQDFEPFIQSVVPLFQLLQVDQRADDSEPKGQ